MEWDELRAASKRARHFGNVAFDGPFSLLAASGAAIAARNYCMLLDAHRDEDDRLRDDLVLMDAWARSINRYCDRTQVAGDPVACAAFACFASRLWLDVGRL